jgi:hypothetical protein
MKEYNLGFSRFDWLMVGRIEKIGKTEIHIFKNSNLTVEMEFDSEDLRDYYYASYKEKWRDVHGRIE